MVWADVSGPGASAAPISLTLPSDTHRLGLLSPEEKTGVSTPCSDSECFPASPAHLGSHTRLVPPHHRPTGVCLSEPAALCSLSEKACCARQRTQPALLTCLSLNSWQALESLGAWKGEEIQNITWTGKRKTKRTGASRQAVGIRDFTVSPSPLVPLLSLGCQASFHLEDLRKRNRHP